MEYKKIKSFNEFKQELSDSEELQEKFKDNPLEAIKEFKQQNPLSTDKWIYRIIVVGLSISIVAIIIGILILMSTGKIDGDKTVPTIITAIGSAAIGALAGLLAPPQRDD